MVPRLLNLRNLVDRHSYFLFGPRQTGKSTLLQAQLPDAIHYNLLDNRVFTELSNNPHQIRSEVDASQSKIVVIDEIQRRPNLLNEVHLQIESSDIHFLLSGSSARSLRGKGVNLLGGRARTCRLHPLSARELGDQFDLNRALEFGLLPPLYFSDEPKEDIQAYISNYLIEEIAAESSARNLPAFSRFLETASYSHGQVINFERIANESQVPTSSVRNYFNILKDTFLIHEVPSYMETRRRKPVSTSKFYLFDIGIARGIQGREGLAAHSPEFGEAFESFILQELIVYSELNRLKPPAYWRSRTNFEVDFIFNQMAIEVKATRNIQKRDFRGLRALREENLLRKYILVSMVDRPRVEDDNIFVLPWQLFLDLLWKGSLSELPDSLFEKTAKN